MSSRRLERVEAQIVREVGDIVDHKLSDPQLGFVTVRSVAVARDLHLATIFVGVVGDAEQCERSIAALTRAQRLIRRELARRLRLRLTPELRFQLDPEMLTEEFVRQELAADPQSAAGDGDEPDPTDA